MRKWAHPTLIDKSLDSPKSPTIDCEFRFDSNSSIIKIENSKIFTFEGNDADYHFNNHKDKWKCISLPSDKIEGCLHEDINTIYMVAIIRNKSEFYQYIERELSETLIEFFKDVISNTFNIFLSKKDDLMIYLNILSHPLGLIMDRNKIIHHNYHILTLLKENKKVRKRYSEFNIKYIPLSKNITETFPKNSDNYVIDIGLSYNEIYILTSDKLIQISDEKD